MEIKTTPWKIFVYQYKLIAMENFQIQNYLHDYCKMACFHHSYRYFQREKKGSFAAKALRIASFLHLEPTNLMREPCLKKLILQTLLIH